MLSESPLYGEKAINESIDNALLLTHLEKLLKGIDQNMVDEEELRFLRAWGEDPHSADIAQIVVDIDDFEFEVAHKRISELIEKLK